AASASSREVIRLQSRHSRVTTRKTTTMRSENPSRQAAIATGSALESRTSGPANDIPSNERARTQYGFVVMMLREDPKFAGEFMEKKKQVRRAPALFQDNLTRSSGF